MVSGTNFGANKIRQQFYFLQIPSLKNHFRRRTAKMSLVGTELWHSHEAGEVRAESLLLIHSVLCVWGFLFFLSPSPLSSLPVYCCCCLANISIPGIGVVVPEFRPFFYVNVADISALENELSYVACKLFNFLYFLFCLFPVPKNNFQNSNSRTLSVPASCSQARLRRSSRRRRTCTTCM